MRRICAAIIVSGLTAVLAAACGGGGKSTSTSTLLPASSVLPQAIQAFDSLQTFHFTLTHQNGTTPIPNGLQLVSADGDVIVPDHLYASITAKAGNQTVMVQVIGIGSQGWITNPFNRQWQPLPNGTTISDFFDPTQGVKAVIGSLQNAEVVGQEKVDGVDTWHVTGTIPSDALTAAVPVAKPGYTVGIEVWIGLSDSLIRRVYLEGPIEPDEANNIVRQLTLSNFGEQVAVTPPPQ